MTMEIPSKFIDPGGVDHAMLGDLECRIVPCLLNTSTRPYLT